MRREKLIAKRKAKGLLQADIAKEIGISVQHYSKIELGERMPSYENMVKIANFFKVKPDYFFYTDTLLRVELNEENLQKIKK